MKIESGKEPSSLCIDVGTFVCCRIKFARSFSFLLRQTSCSSCASCSNVCSFAIASDLSFLFWRQCVHVWSITCHGGGTLNCWRRRFALGNFIASFLFGYGAIVARCFLFAFVDVVPRVS